MKISLLILNLNEKVGLRSIRPEIDLEQFQEVVEVDGVSTDSSFEIIHSYGIRFIPQASRGRGEALSIAFNAYSESCDGIVFFNSDGNEDYRDLGKLINYPKRWRSRNCI
jgi:hypothetical protein